MVIATELRIYFENPVGRVLEHPDGYAYVMYNAGPRKLDDLQSFLTHTSQLLHRRGWCKLLGDQRLMSPFTEEERLWIVDYWITRTADGSQVYGAVLIPEDVFARLSVSQMMGEAREAAMTYRLFESESSAAAWLRQLP
ncbi:hypothetical protein SAMN00120144_0531 [Hymenobacter roseosalivarius DSM 11622]|uniref:STAS/SEC14 domain-containing protein n=1 Tax=Hymenobacter roseosalivarius DSM 11622 TaxID=645990 RepID=A0A1W1VRX1_9BACT|nr:hypothetical protein [Hymenobacter roseosalivarius]SMB96086.1 hypothetical protein SAMN00120144_0531 [Hymenobacter roseosalivarius DSM 11622]